MYGLIPYRTLLVDSRETNLLFKLSYVPSPPTGSLIYATPCQRNLCRDSHNWSQNKKMLLTLSGLAKSIGTWVISMKTKTKKTFCRRQIPFLERDDIDSLPYVVTATLLTLPVSLHEDVIDVLCWHLLPFTMNSAERPSTVDNCVLPG